MALNPADVCARCSCQSWMKSSCFSELNLMTGLRLTHTRAHTFFFFFFSNNSVVLLQRTLTDGDPLAKGGPSVDRWASLMSHWWSTDVCCVCVCVLMRHLEPVWFVLAGSRLLCMWLTALPVCMCVRVLSHFCLTCRLSEVFHSSVPVSRSIMN